MKLKVLYAEDEPFLASIVTDGLKASGYEVFRVEDGAAALEMIADLDPDICILDIMMPHKDGYSVAENIRKMDLKMPIIFLSAKSQPEDVVMGFKSGGNDYLKKPFSMEELIVRMSSLLSRFGEQQEERDQKNIYLFGDCRLDIKSQQLHTADGNHTLSFKETSLLQMLLQHKNVILERQHMLIKLWGDDSYYNSRSLDVFMAHIRKMLKDQQGVQLMSIRGVGYKLLC
jgi:DNA-binding response OmpR family regulator